MSVSPKINEDLNKERQRCNFAVEELTNLLDGGAEKTAARREVEQYVLNIKNIKDGPSELYMGHKERYETTIRKTCLVVDALRKHPLGNDVLTSTNPFTPLNVYRVMFLVTTDVTPVLTHFGMFLPTIASQGTKEQVSEWLPKAAQAEIIGAYVQTEVGHGSFIKGLETTATYDPSTEEFVLHTPKLTSYKWWPGGLGRTANHAVVMAQLYIGNECHGPHVFMVQIRDCETHMPLPGIQVGEIGPKMAFKTADNGFLAFSQHRIPRKNMFMKNAKVFKDGTYKKINNEKLAYVPMMQVRVSVVTEVAYDLSRAVTIAIRYSAIRRQSRIRPTDQENQIIDYKTQQHKLFLALSTSYAIKFIGTWFWGKYLEMTDELETGKTDKLFEIHSILCSMKAVSSRDGTYWVEQCRVACGGHGFIESSNFSTIFGIVSASITYEGDYTVMVLQTAGFLLKGWTHFLEGKSNRQTESINFSDRAKKWQNNPDGIIAGLQTVAIEKIKQAYKTVQKYMSLGKDFESAWNMSLLQLVECGEAYCRKLFCEVFWRETLRLTSTGCVSSSLSEALRNLAELYLTYWALQNKGDLLLYAMISGSDISMLQERYEELLALIRPNAVGFADGFDIRDEILNSSLGAYDGRVYERLMEEALKSPLNQDPVNETFHKFLKPLMKKSKI